MTRQGFRAWILPPLLIGILVALGFWLRLGGWGRVWNLALACAAMCWIAWLQRGGWRNASISIAAILFALAGIETTAIFVQARPVESYSQGYFGRHPVLGWDPGAEGRYRHTKRYRWGGATIFDVHYTIDANRSRAVIAADGGGPVAFLGDSMTFGTGVEDGDTLPQQFADATGRRVPVVNLAMAAYGPQQVLLALETGLHDARLRGVRMMVFQSAPFHAERSSCQAWFVMRAPRYVLEDGVPRHRGWCSSDWWVSLRNIVTSSATYQEFIAPALGGPSRRDMDLYITMLARAATVARERYNAELLVLYSSMLRPDEYLANAGMTDDDVIRALREKGVQVVDGRLDPAAFPGQLLRIPGDGHPTRVANQARAELLKSTLERLPPPAPR